MEIYLANKAAKGTEHRLEADNAPSGSDTNLLPSFWQVV